MQSIFSTYRQGENRVTSTFVNVLGYLPLNIVGHILGTLLHEESEDVNILTINNQPHLEKKEDEYSVPDAVISSNFELLLETKTQPNSIGEKQLEKHLENVGGSSNDGKNRYSALLVLTPDVTQPKIIEQVKKDTGKEIIWSSFQNLTDIFQRELFENDEIILSERDHFLLHSLVRMFEEDNLLPQKDSTLIVAAKYGYPNYKKYGVYICPTNRNFRQVDYLGFYADKAIKPEIPKIVDIHKDVDMSTDGLDRLEKKLSEKGSLSSSQKEMMKNLRDFLQEWKPVYKDGKLVYMQVFELSKGVELNEQIKNNLVSNNNAEVEVPFTYGSPRYVSLKDLQTARSTSDLKN